MRQEQHERVYAAGRLVFEGGGFVATDRLGSVVYKCAGKAAVQNGGFETGAVAPWTAYGGAQHSIVAVPQTGVWSLRQTATTANSGAYQDITGLVPGMQYQFSAVVRSESTWTNARLEVSDTAGNGTQTAQTSAYTYWQWITVTFRATSLGTARVRLVKTDTVDALIWDNIEIVTTNACTLGQKRRYYPYGQEIGSVTQNDTAKFATYTRDATTGLDYAMNRYYQSTWGRFTTADPYRASGGPADPGNWNRYSYVQGDPVNRADPSGLYYCSAEFSLADCLGIQYDIDAGFISTGGGGGGWGPTLGGWFSSPWAWFVPAFLTSPNAPAPEPKPECFAQLKDRPVNDSTAAKFRAVHTFWWVQDSTGTQYIISAGPTTPNSSGTRYLNVSVTPGDDSRGGDSSRSHTAWSSGLSWINCGPVDAMVAAANDWRSSHNNTVVYNPVGAFGIGGPNSNSAAHHFAVVSGFNPIPPRNAYGWWRTIVFP